MSYSSQISDELAARLARIQASYHQDPDTARSECEALINYARAHRATLLQIYAAELYGKIMDHAGEAQLARNFLYEALQQAQAIHNFILEARVCEQIARSYYTSGQYSQALHNWLRCIELAEFKQGEAAIWMLAKVGVGQIYDAQGEQETALLFHNTALARIAEVDDPYLHAKILINIGVVQLKLNRFAEAKTALLAAQHICLAHHYADYAATTYSRLAEIALAHNELDPAMNLLAQALCYARQVKYVWGEANILNNMAQIHTRRAQYPAALECIFAAQQIAKTHHFSPVLLRLHQAAAHNAELAGQTELAITEIKASIGLQALRLQETQNEQYKLAIQKTEVRSSSSSKLLKLMNHPEIERGDSQRFWPLIAQASADILQVAQLSIWRINADDEYIDCMLRYPVDVPSRPQRLTRQDMPVFFASLQHRQPIIAHDAAHHHFAWDLSQAYLKQQQIHSVMAFMVQHNQEQYLLLFKHLGSQRNWLPEEIQLANQLTHIISRALNHQARHQYQHEIHLLNARLSQSHQELEQRVQERTEGLRRTNQELEYTMQQLVQSEKLAALGRLVNGFAGELIPPLIDALQLSHSLGRSSQDIATLLARGELKRSGLQHYLSTTQNYAQLIEQKITRSSELVAQFKLVAVDTSSERRRQFNLQRTVCNLANIFRSQRSNTAYQIELNIPASIELDSYPGPLEQVLSHLIQNALLHGFKNRAHGKITISAEHDGNELIIRCHDNGCGIAQAHFPPLSEPFYSPKPDPQHRGLGLYISNNILNKVLAGNLELESITEQYTQVVIRMPHISPPAVRP
ncbi:ATP-binding protein [Chitinibacter sp. SCUT-21]|uniref:ATP-binding protein n=1 Tax=Chitinibacter sp. SCUT-21 TaxID=2970891 RepID=UPI0035A685C1